MHSKIADELPPDRVLTVLRSLLAELTIGGADIQRVGQQIAEAALELLGRASCEVRVRVREGGLRLIGSAALPGTYLRRWRSLAYGENSAQGRAVLSETPQVVSDADGLSPEEQQLLAEAGARSVIALPLRAHGKVLGVLTIFLPLPHSWGSNDLGNVRLLADVCALSLAEGLAAERVEWLQQQKDDVFTSLSHELRTPLTSVQGYLELIERKLHQHPVEPSIGQYLDIALRQSRVLAESIDQILDAALIEQDRLMLQPAPARPDRLLESAIVDLRQRFGQRLIKADLPPASQEAVWDAERVRQIMGHLVKNAVIYSAPPAPVVVRVSYSEPAVRVVVRDYGPGITRENQQRIFERFWRGVDNSLSKQVYGLGLGLYLSKSLAHRHGGQLFVQSQGLPGQGSTFTLVLPWRAPPDQ